MTRAIPTRASLLAGCAVLALLLPGCGAQQEQAPSRDSRGQVNEADPTADVFALEVGDCLAAVTGEGLLTTIPVVPCSQQHTGEVFHALKMADAQTVPGDAEIEQVAAGCTEPFAAFVGRPLGESVLEVTYFHPTAESWESGDREILCWVSDPAGEVTESLEDADR